MDNLPVGRIEQLSYNDKLKADIAKLMAAQDDVSEKGRLQAEVARLQAENAELTVWGKRAHTEIAYLASRISDDIYSNLLGYSNNRELVFLLENAPDSVKGSDDE